MDRMEALNLFLRGNFKLLLSKKFRDQIFKKAKLDFFLHRRRISVPRNQDIAKHAIKYLINNGAINNENKLAEVLSLPFFAKYIHDGKPFKQLLGLRESSIAILDPEELSKAEFRDRVRKELKQKVIEEETREIREAIKQKREEYLSIPSVLDATNFEEPVGEQTTEPKEQFVPWWKRLRLSEDPFPTQEGLARIADELYEKIVYKTPIFEKYMVLARVSSEELLKDTIFFGEFGSGKTTLFDYLKKPFMNARIFTVYIQLYAEPTFQALLARFREKLFDGLCRLHELLYEGNPKGWLTSSDLQDNVVSLLRKYSGDENIGGLVIIIDDLHKDFDAFNIAMKFINNLQIFKAELVRKIPKINIGFFVAGSADWEKIILNDPKFQGSYIRRESMPPITEEAAHEMLNRRLSAFATNPDSIRTIDLGFVKRIYRGLQNNKLPVTFRSFIRATLREFEKSNFTILTVDPVHISRETLAEIRETLEWNKILKKRINRLLFGGGIQKEENRRRTLQLLVYIYLQKGVSEDSQIFQDNKFFLQRLARSGLIQKAKILSDFKWVICRELDETNRKIMDHYNLSLEDYLTKIYVAPRPVTARKIKKISEELQRVDSLISRLTNSVVKKLAKASRDEHARIIEEMDRREREAESKNIILRCEKSLALLTKAMAKFVGLQVVSKDDLTFLREFWKGFWFSPEEISEFLNQVRGHVEFGQSERIWYGCILYRDAYSRLLTFFADEVDKSRYMMIPVTDLSNDEIEQFHEIRRLWAKNEYFEVVDNTSRLVEKKLRSFLFNLFTLLYGDRQARLSRLDKVTGEYILKNIQKDQEKGLSVSRNEFEQVNRGNYKNFVIGSYNKGIGRDNWIHVFKHVFAPMTENDIKNFLDLFAQFNITTSHVKLGALEAEQQTQIHDYVFKSIDIVRKMNQTYVRLINDEERCLYIEEPRRGTGRHFLFSLDKLEDKDSVTPIFVKPSIATRVGGQLRTHPSISVDLEDIQYIESYFSVDYRQFMAIIARLIMQLPFEAKKTGLRVNIGSSRSPVVMLNITEM